MREFYIHILGTFYMAIAVTDLTNSMNKKIKKKPSKRNQMKCERKLKLLHSLYCSYFFLSIRHKPLNSWEYVWFMLIESEPRNWMWKTLFTQGNVDVKIDEKMNEWIASIVKFSNVQRQCTAIENERKGAIDERVGWEDRKRERHTHTHTNRSQQNKTMRIFFCVYTQRMNRPSNATICLPAQMSLIAFSFFFLVF